MVLHILICFQPPSLIRFIVHITMWPSLIRLNCSYYHVTFQYGHVTHTLMLWRWPVPGEGTWDCSTHVVVITWPVIDAVPCDQMMRPWRYSVVWPDDEAVTLLRRTAERRRYVWRSLMASHDYTNDDSMVWPRSHWLNEDGHWWPPQRESGDVRFCICGTWNSVDSLRPDPTTYTKISMPINLPSKGRSCGCMHCRWYIFQMR